MTSIQIGQSKVASLAHSFDDIALVPMRRVRDTEDVSLAWRIDAYEFQHPIIMAPMDSVASPATVIEYSRLGGLAILDLEGLWTRVEDPTAELAKVAVTDGPESVKRLQELYSTPVNPDLMKQRVSELRDAGVTVAGALSPQRVLQFHDAVIRSGCDIFVIRGTTVSAEHVSQTRESLNLKDFIYQLDTPVIVGGVASYKAALHLMRAGAAGVLVGFGGGATHTTRSVLGVRVPMATAVSEVAAARRDYLEESGGRYVQVIADGAMGRSGDMAKALACGADAVMVGSPLARAAEAPGRGRHWGREAVLPDLPRGEVVELGTVGTLQEIVLGPSHTADGTMNLTGALRKAMATCGYTTVKDFQRCELVVDRS